MAALTEQREMLNPYGNRRENNYVETFEHLKSKSLTPEIKNKFIPEPAIVITPPSFMLHESTVKPPINPLNLQPSDIIDVILSDLNLTVEQMHAKCREQKLITARMLLVYLLKKYIPRIGGKEMASLLNRERTTTISAFKTASNFIKTNDLIFIAHLNRIENKLFEKYGTNPYEEKVVTTQSGNKKKPNSPTTIKFQLREIDFLTTRNKVAALFNVAAEKITTKNNSAEMVMSRNLIAMVYRVSGYKLHDIGKIINRHHSTITHSVRSHNECISNKDEVSEMYISNAKAMGVDFEIKTAHKKRRKKIGEKSLSS